MARLHLGAWADADHPRDENGRFAPSGEVSSISDHADDASVQAASMNTASAHMHAQITHENAHMHYFIERNKAILRGDRQGSHDAFLRSESHRKKSTDHKQKSRMIADTAKYARRF